jgi:hypothetical protein
MNMAERVQCALEDVSAGKLMPALMHACAAVDGTGAKLYPKKSVRDRFVATFEDYLWVVEPMLAIGINLEDTTFKWIALKNRPAKFSEVIYEIFRCNLAHGTEIPTGFSVELRNSDEYRSVLIGQQTLCIPDTIIFAMLGVAVFSKANAEQKINKDSWLSCGSMRFTIDQWWGREKDARICFSTVHIPRVTMEF